MDVQDGFIVGIFNFCDRWCEVCQFTSRCSLFADCAEAEASIDRNFAALCEAPPLCEEASPPPPRWMQEIIDDMNEAARTEPTVEELERSRPRVAPEHEPIEKRAADRPKCIVH